MALRHERGIICKMNTRNFNFIRLGFIRWLINNSRKFQIFATIMAILFHATDVIGQEWMDVIDSPGTAYSWDETSFLVRGNNTWYRWEIIDNNIVCKPMNLPSDARLLGLDKEAMVIHSPQGKEIFVVHKSGNRFRYECQKTEGTVCNLSGWNAVPIKIDGTTYWLTLNFEAGQPPCTRLYLRDHKTFQILHEIPFYNPILDKYYPPEQPFRPLFPHVFSYDILGTSFGKIVVYLRDIEKNTLSAYSLNITEKTVDLLWSRDAKNLNGWKGGCELNGEYLWTYSVYGDMEKICLQTGKVLHSYETSYKTQWPECFIFQENRSPMALLEEKNNEKYVLFDLENKKTLQSFQLPASQEPHKQKRNAILPKVLIHQGILYLYHDRRIFIFDIAIGKLLQKQDILSTQ
ncbi:MAG: hypothetical protein Q4D98_08470 [Planctomycetia bacterium]|nr:hypothetical protein [Planctomycetia bacterium]